MCFRRDHRRRVKRVAGAYRFFKYIRVLRLTSTEALCIARDDSKGAQLIEFIYDHLRTIRLTHLNQIKQTLFSLAIELNRKVKLRR
jgi:predicted kinase